ncbi:MAG: class I SAM-dependent methyltransferase [Alphaproteobacteria bacterium]
MGCLVCGGEAVRPIGTSADWLAMLPAGTVDERRQILERAGRAGWASEFVFLRCADCGFIRIDPLPDTALLTRFYAQYHATEKYAAKAPKKIRRARRRIQRLRAAITGRSFIDVGCNVGFAVEAARIAGFTATGIDIDPDAVTTARGQFPGCAFHTSDIAGFAAQGERFDLVYCAEVLEHITDVRAFIAALSALTRVGGLVYLTTPDAGHIRARNRFLSWDEVKPPEHISWFSKKSLRTAFEAAGFRIERFQLNLKPGIRMVARKLPDPAFAANE